MGNSYSSDSKIIAAIDFGTSYTGYAYAFSENMGHIFTGTHGNFLKDDRVPTVLLLKPDGTLSSFGVDAEDEYARLKLTDTHHKYRQFREFKMALYSKHDKLHKYLTITDTNGTPEKAIGLFSLVIEHLKELILRSMKESKTGETSTFESKIEWILTIPAIWSDSARQFMREAAIQGGIPETNLRLVLEPEAAALFCKNQPLNATRNVKLTKLPPGTKYILADLGGGTADICAHEMLRDGKVRELYRVQGGHFGGSSVNNQYIEFLKNLFGESIWEEFKKNHWIDFIRMMREFEENKIKFDPETTDILVIDVPASLVSMLQVNSLSTYLAKADTTESFTVKENKLICNREIMTKLFKPSVEGIVRIVRQIMNDCKKDLIQTLLVVGGFAESQYVRQFINQEINKIKVVIVQEPRLAVLKGAVMMGLEPKDIIQRRARYTYGFAVARPFQERKHPELLKFIREGRVLCSDIFSKVIEKDQVLKFNEQFKVNTRDKLQQPDSKKNKMTAALFRTDKRDPKYCLETDNCTEVAKITVQPPLGGWPDDVVLELIVIVGETEFTVQAKDKSTGREFDTSVDFL